MTMTSRGSAAVRIRREAGPVRSGSIGPGRFVWFPWANPWSRGAWCGIRSAPGSGDRRPTGDPTDHSTVLPGSAYLLRQRYGREGHRARKVSGRSVLPDREVLRVLGLAAQKNLLTDLPREGAPRCVAGIDHARWHETHRGGRSEGRCARPDPPRMASCTGSPPTGVSCTRASMSRWLPRLSRGS